jgi:hypothetical protein
MNTDPKIAVDRSPSLVKEALVLARSKDWKLENTPQGPGIRGIPATWYKDNSLPSSILAIIDCPKCNNISVLHRNVHTIDHNCKVSPDFKCPHCSLHRMLYLDSFFDKPLWACAIERWKNSKVKAEIVYVHAEDEREARTQLGSIGTRDKIVSIGRAIGFFVHDNHGELLSAEGKLNNIGEEKH